MSVTKARAERVLAGITKQFAAYIDGGGTAPVLYMKHASRSGTIRPAIVWEDGPYDWPQIAFQDGEVDEEMSYLAGRTVKTRAPKLPAGVSVEAINSYSLGIYPADRG